MWMIVNDDNDGVDERQPYNYLPRNHFEGISDFKFKEKFRLNKIQFQNVLTEIGEVLQNKTNRFYSLSAEQKLKIGLHWLGNGGQYHGIADMHGVSKMTVGRCVHEVVDAVNSVLFDTFVKWPQNTFDIIQQFHAIAGFPHVCGVVDGILIKIDAPVHNEPAFVDRHHNHSINCLAVCGPDMKFYYISSNWPGSVHDARVLRNSSLNHRMEEGWRPHPEGVILGDSAYPLKDWLIPPRYNNPEDNAYRRFNHAHKRTRRLIENAFGILKEKFPCLNHMRMDPVAAGNIFKCCATLCNFSKNNEDVEIVEDVDDDNIIEEIEEEEVGHNPPPVVAVARIQQLIEHFRQP
ncbi:UNVERIFIED_CONTAM: hypothetical protein RMT77_015056 [Armadillidium vulgare]